MRKPMSIVRQNSRESLKCPGLSCRNQVFRWASSHVGNPDDAEDVAAEICLHCIRGLDRFRGEAEFSTWLHRIAWNVLNDYHRSKRRRSAAEDNARAETFSGKELVAAQQPVSSTDSERVREALCRLSPRQRHMIEWKYGEGLTHREIADRLIISESAVSQGLYRARGALAKAMQERSNHSK